MKVDPLHWMDRILRELATDHGAYTYFCARLSDTIFLADPEDLASVKAVLMGILKDVNTEKEWRAHMNKNWKYVLRFCRRYIPKPDVLVPRLQRLHELFADIRDAKTNRPLFGKKAEKAWKNLIDHAAK